MCTVSKEKLKGKYYITRRSVLLQGVCVWRSSTLHFLRKTGTRSTKFVRASGESDSGKARPFMHDNCCESIARDVLRLFTGTVISELLSIVVKVARRYLLLDAILPLHFLLNLYNLRS